MDKTSKEYKKHMRAVERNGFMLKYVPEELRTKELCEIAVAQEGYAIAFVPEELELKNYVMLQLKISHLLLGLFQRNLRQRNFVKWLLEKQKKDLYYNMSQPNLKPPNYAIML